MQDVSPAVRVLEHLEVVAERLDIVRLGRRVGGGDRRDQREAQAGTSTHRAQHIYRSAGPVLRVTHTSPVVRLALASLCLLAATARAGELPRRLGMYPTQGGQAALAMLDSKLEVTVRGPIVETVATQTFRNDTDRVTEATYIFPLPADAAVSAMSIVDGARTIRAAIERRADAQRRYEDAVAAGLSAGLLDQERPDVFTQTVSAIPAHGSVTVVLRYDATASFHDGTWELALPLVVAPRYVPGGASGRPTTGTGRAPDTDRAPDDIADHAGRRTGRGRARRSVAIRFAEPVTYVASTSHEITGSGQAYSFVDPNSDHDAIVRWRAPAQASGWVEQDDDGVATRPSSSRARSPRHGQGRRCTGSWCSIARRPRAATRDLVERPLDARAHHCARPRAIRIGVIRQRDTIATGSGAETCSARSTRRGRAHRRVTSRSLARARRTRRRRMARTCWSPMGSSPMTRRRSRRP